MVNEIILELDNLRGMLMFYSMREEKICMSRHRELRTYNLPVNWEEKGNAVSPSAHKKTHLLLHLAKPHIVKLGQCYG